MVQFQIDRPKLASTNQTTETILAGTPTDVGNDTFEIRVYADGITLDVEAIVDLTNVTWSSGGLIITGQTGDFDNVREGDVVTSTSGTDFASAQFVSSVSPSGATPTVTLNAVTDGNTDSGNGASTLTFTPGDVDSTLYHIRLAHVSSGSNLVVTPTISCHDGTLAFDDANDDDSDSAAFADGTSKTLPSFSINLDTYLTNARVARTNV